LVSEAGRTLWRVFNRSDQLNPNNDRYQGNADSGDD
jgi:hypothetical protein